ncbi:MAG: transketolase [Candidatus Hydrogenedentota bacterium]
MSFPIPVNDYEPLVLDPSQPALTPDQLAHLQGNVQLVRDVIIFYTAIAGIKGLAGHTGGAYSIVPEVLIADAFMRGSDKVYPAFFDEAGHRVAIQYAMAAFNGHMPFEKLYHYREYGHGLFGHPELEPEEGIMFSSGRLGHLWPFVNGVALAHPGKTVFLFGSDGSQMEGDDAEAARLAVAQKLNVKLCIDDNNVTISGHPKDYLPGYDIGKTLAGHGLTVDAHDAEDLAALYQRMQKAMATDGPVALINKRVMAPGVPGIENNHAGHDVIKKDHAVAYLTARGHTAAVDYLNNVKVEKTSQTYLGSSKETAGNRVEFGTYVNEILAKMTPEERKSSVIVIDSDLEGSTGLKAIRTAHPDVCINGGVQERGNFSAAAGFGFTPGKQGIFSTFSAFLEMIVSEATMARLNKATAICHFSHAGVDEIADNTCHFGINVFFADAGLEDDDTKLYFPGDALQLKALLYKIWNDRGLRYVFTNRSKIPFILNEDGSKFYDGNYTFTPGKDEIIRKGTAGYVVSYGELLYRALDAVEQARKAGIDVGLINKPTLNVVDEETTAIAGKSPFVLVVEGQNLKTGLGARYGTWLIERGLTPKFARMGVTKPGCGGIEEQVPFQGLAPYDILEKIKAMGA